MTKFKLIFVLSFIFTSQLNVSATENSLSSLEEANREGNLLYSLFTIPNGEVCANFPYCEINEHNQMIQIKEQEKAVYRDNVEKKADRKQQK